MVSRCMELLLSRKQSLWKPTESSWDKRLGQGVGENYNFNGESYRLSHLLPLVHCPLTVVSSSRYHPQATPYLKAYPGIHHMKWLRKAYPYAPFRLSSSSPPRSIIRPVALGMPHLVMRYEMVYLRLDDHNRFRVRRGIVPARPMASPCKARVSQHRVSSSILRTALVRSVEVTLLSLLQAMESSTVLQVGIVSLHLSSAFLFRVCFRVFQSPVRGRMLIGAIYSSSEDEQREQTSLGKGQLSCRFC